MFDILEKQNYSDRGVGEGEDLIMKRLYRGVSSGDELLYYDCDYDCGGGNTNPYIHQKSWKCTPS